MHASSDSIFLSESFPGALVGLEPAGRLVRQLRAARKPRVPMAAARRVGMAIESERAPGGSGLRRRDRCYRTHTKCHVYSNLVEWLLAGTAVGAVCRATGARGKDAPRVSQKRRLHVPGCTTVASRSVQEAPTRQLLADAGFERTENAQQWGGEANGVGGGLVSWNGAWLCCCSLVGLTESTQESTCNCRAYSTWFRP